MAVLSDVAADDLFNLVCGDVIGRGQYRTVYEHHLRTECVIKHDNRGNYSNVLEFTLWKEVEGTPLEKWFAPVYWLSPGGIWLVQAKTEPLRAGELPKRVPAIFADLKAANWGWLNGRPVCHDFGNSQTYNLALAAAGNLLRAEWDKKGSS